MMQDDETTAKELVTSLQGAGVSVSLSTTLKGRRLLGWTRRGTAYCQLIRAQNRQNDFSGHRSIWARTFTMLFGEMKPPFKWKHTVAFGAGRKVKILVINPAPNTQ